MSIGQQLLDVPFGDMVASLGMAIAEAQCALDHNSIEILKLMGEADTVELPMVTMSYRSGQNNRDKNYGIEIVDTPYKTSMIGAGFQPTFYQFAETVIEVKMAISMSYESSSERNVKTETKTNKKNFWRNKSTARTTTVDATYSSKYNYSAEGSSLLRTRLVPVPPNTIIAQVIDMRNQAMNKIFELESQRVTAEIEAATKKLEEEQTSPTSSTNE
ncbi:hypothetical protein [uncultured Fibrobacter sp.]|uniref:hypothetical protein n=1 Tax=uncultured Fibrobacter sp. TaxID=261512 RepID=UPI0026273331|nr:hypothetical protein [uncultured Fibrobacter sp.]